MDYRLEAPKGRKWLPEYRTRAHSCASENFMLLNERKLVRQVS